MFNVNDIVIVKSEKDFEKDILNGLCYKTDTGSIYYKNDRNQIPFSPAMKKFYDKKFVVANCLNDNEVYLYTDEDDLNDVVRYTFTVNMLKPYIEDEVDNNIKEDLTKEDYLNLISFVNYGYSDLVTIMKRQISSESEEYIINRMKYLDKLKEKLCDKILK